MGNESEIGVKDLRGQLADILNDTAVYGHITYVTSRGRRVAAIVPVPVADQAVTSASHEAVAA